MPCDLEHVYGKLRADLPEDSNNDERFLLDETTSPAAPAELASDRLIITKALYQRLPGCSRRQIRYSRTSVYVSSSWFAGTCRSFSRRM